MAITLYYSPMSSATRIHWALEELGVPYEKVKIDTKAGAQRSPDYLKLNPNGKVPTLVDDGVPMFESLAMIIHLGEKYGAGRKLWPAAGTADRMHALTWATWGTVTFATHVFRYMSNTAERFPAEQRNAAQAASAKKEIEACLQILNDQLAGKEYMLASGFSLVDVANASMVAFTMRTGLDMGAYPNVLAWFARSTQRPGMAVAAAG
jgi:glutathione S-transferase